MKNIILICLVVICGMTIVSSCSSNNTFSLDEVPGYLSYVESSENGLVKKIDMDVLEFTAQYKPLEYILFKERKVQTITDDSLTLFKDGMDGLQYYTLRMKSNHPGSHILKVNAQSQHTYEQRIAYLSFDAQHDFYLVQGEDTLECHLYQWARNYGIAPYTDVVLAFDNSQGEEALYDDRFLVYDDKLFGTGPVKFHFKGSDIKKTPKLKI